MRRARRRGERAVSEPSGAVEEEGDGAVVGAGDEHVSGEEAGFHRYAGGADEVDGFFVELLGQSGFGGLVEAGASASASAWVTLR